MLRFNSWLLVTLFIAAATVACAAPPVPEAGADDKVVARVGETEITVADLEELVGPKLTAIRQQIYDVQTKAIEGHVFDLLVEQAAGKAGVAKEQWLQENLQAMISEPSEEEIQAVMAQFRSRLAPDDEQARKQVVDHLNQNSAQKAQAELRKKLMTEGSVEIFLDPPRVEPVIGDLNPSKGPADAPVVLVEYTDFQCPYCGRVQPTLEQLRERYGDSIRTVFKNLPLAMHQQARFAAEAALCAGEQDGFWPLHAWLFANHRDIKPETVYAQAEALGLDAKAIEACVSAGTHGSVIEADMKEAASFGITGTPGFVVNGRIVTGAQPFENFVTLIDDELRRIGVAVPGEAESKETKE